MQDQALRTSTSAVADAYSVARALVDGASSVLRGKESFLELFVAGIMAGGRLLIEDKPGLGKTTAAKTFAKLISDDAGKALSFKRIQFTPDLLPYDITGVDVFDSDAASFRFMPGPIFAHVVLADEINRTTPKVQSALLEAMAEGQVTVGGATHMLPDPFILIATQNPVESDGTFPLPVAQLDRFMMRLSIGYPDAVSELSILRDDPGVTSLEAVKPQAKLGSFLAAQRACGAVHCSDALVRGVLGIVTATRDHRLLSLGVSPRGGLNLLHAARAFALVRGRDFVSDEDVIEVGPAVLAHRIRTRDARTDAAVLARELCLGQFEKNGRR